MQDGNAEVPLEIIHIDILERLVYFSHFPALEMSGRREVYIPAQEQESGHQRWLDSPGVPQECSRSVAAMVQIRRPHVDGNAEVPLEIIDIDLLECLVYFSHFPASYRVDCVSLHGSFP